MAMTATANGTRRMTMSWWSDGEPFDEWEGCRRCNFSKNPSKKTCKGCKTGDYWNYGVWDEEEEEEDDEAE